MSRTGKRLLPVFVLVLLLLGPLCSGSTKPAYGTTAELLQQWKQRITNLSNDLETYKQQLMVSRERLVALQARLTKLQTELMGSSLELTRALESSANLQNSLDTLKASLAAQSLQVRRQKIAIGIVAAVTGAALGIIVAVIFLGSMP